jgi:hypothetical protein
LIDCVKQPQQSSPAIREIGCRDRGHFRCWRFLLFLGRFGLHWRHRAHEGRIERRTTMWTRLQPEFLRFFVVAESLVVAAFDLSDDVAGGSVVAVGATDHLA